MLTGVTSTLVVEIDGEAESFAAALVARGVTAVADRQRVLVTLPDDRDVIDSRAVFDAVRDVAVLRDTALLRMERRRGHLEDLFTLTS